MRKVDPANIITAGLTDVGRVRSSNQDSIGEFVNSHSSLRLLVVADGMGGHRGGEVASQMAVDAVGEVFRGATDSPRELLQGALERANQQVNEASGRDRNLRGMGTTCVALLFGRERNAWVAHVGDSRAYCMHDGKFVRLTDDHSVVGELLRQGQISAEEARVHPQRNEILRAIGTQDSVEVDVNSVTVSPGDRFLLCSDGLSTMLSDDEIAAVLAREGPESATRTLVDLANERGGADNISVQIAAIPGTQRRAAKFRPEARADAGTSSGRIWAAALIALALALWLLLGR